VLRLLKRVCSLDANGTKRPTCCLAARVRSGVGCPPASNPHYGAGTASLMCRSRPPSCTTSPSGPNTPRSFNRRLSHTSTNLLIGTRTDSNLRSPLAVYCDVPTGSAATRRNLSLTRPKQLKAAESISPNDSGPNRPARRNRSNSMTSSSANSSSYLALALAQHTQAPPVNRLAAATLRLLRSLRRAVAAQQQQQQQRTQQQQPTATTLGSAHRDYLDLLPRAHRSQQLDLVEPLSEAFVCR